MHLLDGQVLTSVQASPAGQRWTFAFDLGGVLATRALASVEGARDEQWFLFEPSGWVLSVRGDGHYGYSPGDTPPAESRWLPLSEPPQP